MLIRFKNPVTDNKEYNLNMNNVVGFENGNVKGTTLFHLLNGQTVTGNLTPRKVRSMVAKINKTTEDSAE